MLIGGALFVAGSTLARSAGGLSFLRVRLWAAYQYTVQPHSTSGAIDAGTSRAARFPGESGSDGRPQDRRMSTYTSADHGGSRLGVEGEPPELVARLQDQRQPPRWGELGRSSADCRAVRGHVSGGNWI